MRVGDIIESAMWVTGEESPELRARYERDVAEAIDYLCSTENLARGPLTWTEKRPEAEGVPPVPDHIQGERVRLLVGEAEITGKAPEQRPDSFVANLEPKDLESLRAITKRSYAKHYRRTLTDAQCDEVIEALGPDAAIDTLRQTIH